MADELRYPHAPGDLVPVRVTADALRRIYAALLRAGREDANAAARLPPVARDTYIFSSETALGLADEVADAFNRTPSDTDRPYPETPVIIGTVLLQHRRVSLKEDLAELERRDRGNG